MKVSNDFLLREIADEYVLIPVGAAASKFVGLITLNESASVLFNALSVDRNLEDLVEIFLSEFDVDRDTAISDINEFLQELRKIGALL